MVLSPPSLVINTARMLVLPRGFSQHNGRQSNLAYSQITLAIKWIHFPLFYPSDKLHYFHFLFPDLPSAIKLLKVLLSEVMDFKSKLPVLSCLLNPALRFRHWDAIQEAVGGEDVKLSKDMTASITDLVRVKVWSASSEVWGLIQVSPVVITQCYESQVCLLKFNCIVRCVEVTRTAFKGEGQRHWRPLDNTTVLASIKTVLSKCHLLVKF